MITITIIYTLVILASAQKNNNFLDGRSTIVHMFEWKWSDIADECERFLGPKGYAGIQISPPNENQAIVSHNRPWWERYQPVSYELTTRSGNENELADMINRCNAVGVRTYVDAVINHMAAIGGVGTAGNECDPATKDFPAVPYTPSDFHETCPINNYNDPENVRNCELEGLVDLDHSLQHVREKVVGYLNNLIDLGVAGFRIDAAKHMWPADLGEMYSSLKDLSTEHGFEPNTKPFIFQEVIDLDGNEGVHKEEYIDIGAVLEFLYGFKVGEAFQGWFELAQLKTFGTSEWNLLESGDAVVFIDNHDNQRHGFNQILTYKKPKLYKMAIAYMLAAPYGTTRIISSFAFEDTDIGPPQDSEGNLLSPVINADGSCSSEWVCEHRWRQIVNMVAFRSTVSGTEIENWWDNEHNQIAFSRGNKGFIAFTVGGDINETLQTSLPAGTYCDIISGNLENGQCTGKSVQVDASGLAAITLGQEEEDGVLAISVDSKLM